MPYIFHAFFYWVSFIEVPPCLLQPRLRLLRLLRVTKLQNEAREDESYPPFIFARRW